MIEKKEKNLGYLNTILLSFVTFILSLLTYNVHNMNNKLEKALIDNSTQEEKIVNNQNNIAKNTFHIEKIKNDRFTQKDAENTELKIKSWTNLNFLKKNNKN